MNTKNILSVCLVLFCCVSSAAGSYIILEDAQATGGVKEIKELIDPMIDRAIIALENNNTELALEEIQTLKNELTDTFSVDENDKD